MSGAIERRGGAPVGYLDELPEVEAKTILYLRLWADGPDAQSRVRNDFANGLGQTQGRIAVKTFEQLFSTAVQHSRRPLMRHDVTCKCLGADEAEFANFVGAASAGKREDAMLIATLLVRSDMALLITALAEQFGQALKRMTLRMAPGRVSTERTSRMLH